MAQENEDITVDDLLKLHPALQINETGRLKCLLTDHEMPLRKEVILQHVNGKKYKRLTNGLNKVFDYKQYEPYLVESTKRGREHQLYCKLTASYIDKQPHYIERHVKGKKYLTAKKLFDECTKTGKQFVSPYIRSHMKKQDVIRDKDEHAENLDQLDDLSDLYPDFDEVGDNKKRSKQGNKKKHSKSLKEMEPSKQGALKKRKTRPTKKQVPSKKRLRASE